MLINLRNALIGGKRLPYDAEVEYLESTGTQWIDTGVVATNNTRVKIAFSDYTQAGAWLFGTRRGFRNAALGIYTGSNTENNRWLRAFGNFISNNFVFSTIDLGVSTFDYDCGHFTGTREKVPITIEYTDTASAFDSSPYNIYLWTVNLAGTPGAVSSAKIYATQIWQNGVLVRDFIPVRKGTVGYLYDRVSGKLFGNAGTGDFVLGPDVVPVEYIESHGTEYIDTGVIGNSSTKVELKAQGTNTSAFQTLLGGRDSNGLYSFAVWQRATLIGAYGMRWDYLATNTIAGDGYVLDGVWNTSQPNSVIKDGANNYLNGVQLRANASNSFSCNFPLALFAMNTGGSKGSFFVGKMFMCKIFNNNTPTRNYTPVRVGTDATSWEGAMMDVLTRRIYRNAGTGAFTYGNDLKYPIPAS